MKQRATPDQLPNLKALVDYIAGASYRKSHGNRVIACTAAQLSEYFDKMEEVDEVSMM